MDGEAMLFGGFLHEHDGECVQLVALYNVVSKRKVLETIESREH
jgi:hypothetical protein